MFLSLLWPFMKKEVLPKEGSGGLVGLIYNLNQPEEYWENRILENNIFINACDRYGAIGKVPKELTIKRINLDVENAMIRKLLPPKP